MNPFEILIHDGPDCVTLPIAGALATPESMAAPSEKPDARIYLTDHDGALLAHAALWWTNTPDHDGEGIGTIGGFAATDATTSRVLLDAATARLAQAGCRIAVGPMNGNTWRRHRFVVESNGRGPFLLEPRNPDTYPGWWCQAGFGVMSRYSSSLISLDGKSTIAPELRVRLKRSGIVMRSLDPDRFEDELLAIYRISLQSFAANFLYTPLDEQGFLKAYLGVRDYVDAELVRIAERDGVPCGFMFCIRDLEADARGEVPAMVVKTLAVDPAARCGGLGSLLVDDAQSIGFAKGYREAIHALQYATNNSLKITHRHHGQVFRRYALFSRRL